MKVNRTYLPIWVRRRWRRNGDQFEGFYRTPYGSYPGRIIRRYRATFEFFIYDPPACLWDHSHARCFVHVENDMYRVHFSKRGYCVDDGLTAIERILIDAHERHG